ncbi:hypothetical protein ACVA51_17485 [Pseudomonas luteola]
MNTKPLPTIASRLVERYLNGMDQAMARVMVCLCRRPCAALAPGTHG